MYRFFEERETGQDFPARLFLFSRYERSHLLRKSPDHSWPGS